MTNYYSAPGIDTDVLEAIEEESKAKIDPRTIYVSKEELKAGQRDVIESTICAIFSIEKENLHVRCRVRDEYCLPRQMCIYFLAKYTKANIISRRLENRKIRFDYIEITGYYGMNRTTFYNSIRAVKNGIETDIAFRGKIEFADKIIYKVLNQKNLFRTINII